MTTSKTQKEVIQAVPVMTGHNQHLFLIIHQTAVFYHGEAVVTAPLRNGVEFNALALTTTDASLASGAVEVTQTLDPELCGVKALYISAGGVPEKVELPWREHLLHEGSLENYRIIELDQEFEVVLSDGNHVVITLHIKANTETGLMVFVAETNRNHMVSGADFHLVRAPSKSKAMKRYMLFSLDEHESSGGFHDFVESFASPQDVVDFLEDIDPKSLEPGDLLRVPRCAYLQLVDLQTSHSLAVEWWVDGCKSHEIHKFLGFGIYSEPL